MPLPLRVLLVEDSADDAELIMRELQRGEFDPDVNRVWKEHEFKQALSSSVWDLIISDYSLPDMDATHCLEIYKESGFDMPFILVSGTIGEEIAVMAMKSGAHDYIMKDRLSRLVPAVKRELREAAIRKENRDFTEHLRFLAFYDPVTRLPNKRKFLQDTADSIRLALEKLRNFELAYVEIENLNDVRTVFSQVDCDALVYKIGERLIKNLKDSFAIARIDENSFGITLPENHTGQMISEIFDKPFLLEQFSLQMYTRIGLASFPGQGSNVTELLQHAIIASTQARSLGKVMARYDATVDHSSPENLALLGELRHGIDNGELLLNYQPIMNLQSNKISSVEALVRWQHPVHGRLPPARFLKSAERSNLIEPLTRWVITAACTQRKTWFDIGVDIPIAVNLSIKDVQNMSILTFIRGICDELSLSPEHLHFEITESNIMTDPIVASRVLQQLHDMGAKIAIDDFGTGHSSLAYLKKLPIDIIKVDRTFINNMTRDEREFTIVRAVLDIATQFGQMVVAEGVENAKTLELLQEMECPCAQGNFFDKPMDAEAITRKLVGNA
jgi:predicted signal transduction protein with EAL and GGDEF domain